MGREEDARGWVEVRRERTSTRQHGLLDPAKEKRDVQTGVSDT